MRINNINLTFEEILVKIDAMPNAVCDQEDVCVEFVGELLDDKEITQDEYNFLRINGYEEVVLTEKVIFAQDQECGLFVEYER